MYKSWFQVGISADVVLPSPKIEDHKVTISGDGGEP